MSYFDFFQGLVEAYRKQTDIAGELQATINNPRVLEKPEFLEFVLLVIQQPRVYMNVLMAAVFMDTFGPRVTSKIKELFTGLSNQDNVALVQALPAFVNAQQDDANITAVSKDFFQTLVRTWDGEEKATLKNIITSLVNAANKTLGDNAGDKALVAVQTVVYGYGAATLLATYGCENNLLNNSEICEAAKKAKTALTLPVVN